jgi:hypothetical protein
LQINFLVNIFVLKETISVYIHFNLFYLLSDYHKVNKYSKSSNKVLKSLQAFRLWIRDLKVAWDLAQLNWALLWRVRVLGSQIKEVIQAGSMDDLNCSQNLKGQFESPTTEECLRLVHQVRPRQSNRCLGSRTEFFKSRVQWSRMSTC